MTKYNKTQLHPEIAFEKHVFHRDMFSHYLRWTNVLKRAKIGMRILDVGCGSGNLAEVLYRNKYKAKLYLGLDIRSKTIKANNEKFKRVPWVQFAEIDAVKEIPFFKSIDLEPWDIIVSFETVEHVGKEHVEQLLLNIKRCMSLNTIFLVSTPCYDSTVGAAANHIINNEIGEMTYAEFKEKLLKINFKIVNHWGTFASKKDYKKLIPSDLKPYFDRLNEYYDDNLISNLMAPLFPAHSRNVIWELKLNNL